MYKILSKLVDKCWRYSKPNQCHFWAWLKRPIFGVHDSQGSAETLVRRGGITNYHLYCIFFRQYLCQKLPKLVDVHWSYSVQRHCCFFETQCANFSHLNLWCYWTKVHHIRTRCRGIICAIKLLICIAIFQSVLKCSGAEWRSFCQFCSELVAMARSL